MNAKISKSKKMLVGAMAGIMVLNPILASAANWRTSVPPPGGRAGSPRLQGVVKLANPVAHAAIRVLDASGNLVAEQKDATNEAGYFSVAVPEAAERGGLRVESVGGQVAEHPFEGSLMGSAQGEGNLFVHLNPATTLSVAYQVMKPGATQSEADSRVKRFLDLPEQLDLGISIENPYLTLFSSAAFERAADEAGGWDRYVAQLADEMARSDEAAQAFPAPNAGTAQQAMLGNPYAMWVGEKLLSGIVSAAGSQMFSKFMEGIGFGDKTSQIFDMLNQVMARLAEIQNSLNRIEQAIHQANYDVRASALWKKYAQVVSIMDQVTQVNLQALANMGPDGKPKDPRIAQQVKEAGENLRKQIIAIGLSFVSDVHAEFVSEGTITPLPKVFATARWLDSKPIINTQYFKMVYGQLEQYRSFQVVSTALLVDALRVDNEVQAKAALNVAVKYIGEEKVIFPDEQFFKSKHVDNVTDGKALYHTNQNVVWDLSYQRFNSCEEVWDQAQGVKNGFTLPSVEMMRGLISDGKVGGRFSEVAKKLGFTAADADATKMITVLCIPGRMTMGGDMYQWFGNDQSGPWDVYLDGQGQYDNVRRAKGVTGIYTMKVRPLF